VNQLRAGLVGAGGISGVHADGWRSLGAELTVFALHGAEELAGRMDARVVTSFAELLDTVDVVDVLTPSAHHRAYAVAALQAGRAVVCEKPLARTLDDALAIARAAHRSGGLLLPAHVVRYFPEYAAAKEAVDDGRLGELAVLRFSRSGAAPTPGSWFFDEAASGGIIMDQMIHDLDQARWIAGPVTEVYAVQNPAPARGGRPERVVAHVVLTHASGAISHVQGAWGDATATFATSFAIAGSGGVLEHDSLRGRTLLVDAPPAEGYLPDLSGGQSPYAAEIADLVAAMDGGTPRVSAADGVIAVALAEAARASVRAGRTVPFAERQIVDQIEEDIR
jgi:myo-inositol 2-dehydrogenase/D-chiro-inositol 1-dehydrogenase